MPAVAHRAVQASVFYLYFSAVASLASLCCCVFSPANAAFLPKKIGACVLPAEANLAFAVEIGLA